MKNKLSDLNNHLFAQLERLGDEELDLEAIEKEAKRTDAIVQVADNIISNAVKYSPKGSIITVMFLSDETTAGFAVRDSGPGIPESERHLLFKDFGRLSAKPTGGEKSTGLGLAICRKIVEAHGGTIGVQNLPERGAEFVVSLPLPK